MYADIDSIREFRKFLNVFVQQQKAILKMLKIQYKNICGEWNDLQYQHFGIALNDYGNQILKCKPAFEEYAKLLDKKIAILELYLETESDNESEDILSISDISNGKNTSMDCISTNSLLNYLKNLGSNDKDDKWNSEYMPLVKENIRRSVEELFSEYISKDKMEQSLQKLSFMNQDELKKRYGKGFKSGTLGFNDGESSNIASDISQPVRRGKVGEQRLSGSENASINHAFVTAVHENLHMMSANDTSFETKRGIMIGKDAEYSRAMNEAVTEYFTYLSCGGDRPLGGLYPGAYSGYHGLMEKMPIIEKAVGRDCMMDAYFNNKPELIRASIDQLLGKGAWDDMYLASYDLLYNNNSNSAATRLIYYFDKLSLLCI